MLRGNVAATSLKILWKNLYLVKCYDKSKMNVFILSLWENFPWGLIYFDQFICYTVGIDISTLFEICKYVFTLCVQEVAKQVLFQTVKTQMKCSIKLHFIRVYTVFKGKKDFQTKECFIFLKI